MIQTAGIPGEVAAGPEHDTEEPPPVLKSWRNIYLLVLGNLVFWITLFYIFTWVFQ